jgi:hypothetical protein
MFRCPVNALCWILILLFLTIFGCTTNEISNYTIYDSSSSKDDTSDAAGMDTTGGSSDCSAPQMPPRGYFDNEASWILVRFDDPTLPIMGLYAYFWIDWYSYQGCSYTSAVSTLFMRDGSRNNVLANGGTFTGLSVDYLSNQSYDIFAQPYLHVRNDPIFPLIFHIDFAGDAFSGRMDVLINNVHFWSETWFSFYDATVTDAVITVDGKEYYPKGQATIERWFSHGGLDPAASDFIEGYWVYSPHYWKDQWGRRINTLLYYWVSKENGQEVVQLASGKVSIGTEQFDVVSIRPKFDYSENDDSGGLLRKHRMFVQLSNGKSLWYVVEVDKEYVDNYNAPWEDLLPNNASRKESHSLASGTLHYNGIQYEGGGLFEWKSTTFNPLLD